MLKLRKPNGELGETHLPMMVSTAFEVASALQYLHNKVGLRWCGDGRTRRRPGPWHALAWRLQAVSLPRTAALL